MFMTGQTLLVMVLSWLPRAVLLLLAVSRCLTSAVLTLLAMFPMLAPPSAPPLFTMPRQLAAQLR